MMYQEKDSASLSLFSDAFDGYGPLQPLHQYPMAASTSARAHPLRCTFLLSLTRILLFHSVFGEEAASAAYSVKSTANIPTRERQAREKSKSMAKKMRQREKKRKRKKEKNRKNSKLATYKRLPETIMIPKL